HGQAGRAVRADQRGAGEPAGGRRSRAGGRDGGRRDRYAALTITGSDGAADTGSSKPKGRGGGRLRNPSSRSDVPSGLAPPPNERQARSMRCSDARNSFARAT